MRARSCRHAGDAPWNDSRIPINEYIGPPHLQYRESAMEIMNAVMGALDQRFRREVTTGNVIEHKTRPDRDYVLEVDPSEGVRAHELDDFIRRSFEVLYEAPMGGTVLQHLLWELVANFDFADPMDRCLLEWICSLEEALCEDGGLPSDYMFYVGCCKGEAGTAPQRTPLAFEALPRAAPSVDASWRAEPAAVEHFHRVATGDPGCDWLTMILSELDGDGCGADSKVLWIGGAGWMRAVLEERFDEVVDLRPTLLVSKVGQFDLAFGAEPGVLRRSRTRTLAAVSLLLNPNGRLVTIERRTGTTVASRWVDRFGRTLAERLEVPCLPEVETLGLANGEALVHFSSLDRTPLGGDLLEPILDLYWPEIPEARRAEVLRMLATIEGQGLRWGAFESSKQGVVRSGPAGRARALLALLLGR